MIVKVRESANRFKLYLLPTTLTVWHDVDLPAEVGDGPGEVVMDILLLVSETPAGRLYGRFFHHRVLGVCLVSHNWFCSVKI